MAPAVPFALLGAVQLTSVAAWLGLAGAVSFPRLRRRVTPLFVIGALLMAAADAVTAVRFGPASSDGTGWLRAVALLLLALGAWGGSGQSLVVPRAAGMAGVVVPLGARPAPAAVAGVLGVVGAVGAAVRGRRANADTWLGAALAAGLFFTGVAAALAAPARDSLTWALAVLAARAAATVALAVALVLLARLLLVGKIVGAILAGVVAMAVGAVAVVGTSVASQVQSEQSQRLLQIAQGEQQSLTALLTRAALFARIVGQCPTQHAACVNALRLFAEEPDYFGVVVVPHRPPAVVAPNRHALGPAALVQLAGSAVVQQALRPGVTAQAAPSDVMLLPGEGGRPPRLALVAAIPGRPGGSTDARVRPTFAAVYGIGVVDAYLRSTTGRPTGYDVSVIADGRVIASSLGPGARAAMLAESRSARASQVDASADASANAVVPAEGDRPTVAFVPITDSRDVRIATIALSQPANEALRAQRGVLRRLFLTALIALVVVALLAIALAQRIAEPVRRLTVAAGRVRRGDLETSTSVTSRDEVGRLSRAFDAMTMSLRRATQDLRDRAATEAELRARLETVVASMSDGLVVTDGRGVVTAANPTATRLLGRDVDDVLGQPIGDVVTVVDGEGRSVLRGSSRRTAEAELVRSDGDRVPVRVGSAPLGGDGEGQVIVIADRTREHEIERMKTEFLSNVSHELRTPLTPIRGYAEMLVRRPELTRAQVETFLDEILSSTSRMSRAVELLVDVAALEAGRVEPQRARTPVRSLADERISVWKERYPDRATDFKRKLAAKLPAVDVDRHWVGRALDEFADNAVKYTPKGTPIVLGATLVGDGSGVRLAVRDSGPGFDPRRVADLVGDFSQADASETRRVGGLGLGLGFVSRVADRFGLKLEVETRPGKGSEFAIIAPTVADR